MQLIRVKPQHRQVGKITRLWRYHSILLIIPERKSCQAGEIAQFRRDLTTQRIAVQKQPFQLVECSQFGRNRTA